MKNKWIVIMSIVLGITIIGAGVFTSNASQASPKLSSEEVKQLVLSQYPGEITEIELEKKRDKAFYEIEVISNGKEYELKLDGNSGEVIQLTEKEVMNDGAQARNEKGNVKEKSNKQTDDQLKNKDNDSAKTKQDKKAIIDINKAIEIAKKEFPGTVTDVELDEEDELLIYEVEIKSGNEEADIEIDANTGEVLVIEIETEFD